MSGPGAISRSSAGLLARLLAVLGAVAVLAASGSAAAVSPDDDDEEYPPDAIVNLLDPLNCDPVSISGEIGTVEPGSTVTLQVILTAETTGIVRLAAPVGDVLGEVSGAADEDGQLDYTIPIESNRYGTVVVFASGTDSVGDRFTLSTTAEIVACPEGQLPRTGNSDVGRWLQIAGLVVVVGIVLAAAARRRHLRAGS